MSKDLFRARIYGKIVTYWWAEFSQTTPLGGISVATRVLATWLQQVLFLSVFPRNGQHLDAVMLLVKRKIFASPCGQRAMCEMDNQLCVGKTGILNFLLQSAVNTSDKVAK